MKTMKTMISLLLCLSMLAGLAACGAQPQPAEKEQKEAAPSGEITQLAAPVYPTGGDFLDDFDKSGLDAFTVRSLAAVFADLDGGNRVYSPLNVYLALAMLAEITEGDSRAQLLDLLGCDSVESLRSQVKALVKASYRAESESQAGDRQEAAGPFSGAYQPDVPLTVLPAASFWLRDDYDYKTEALQHLAQDYYAAAFRGPMGDPAYTQALRDWINEMTHDLLKAQADGLELSADTVIALVTTLYFKGRWADEFSAGRTEKDLFHADSGDVEADFMHRGDVMSYYRGAHFGAIRLDMYGGAGMWILLPDEGTSLQQLIDSGEAAAFLADYDSAESKRVQVEISLPRFDVSSEQDLIKTLQSLGLRDVFDPERSDFSPLTEEALFVSDILHAARVKIDEEGCEAAAFTEMLVAAGMPLPPDETVDFVCDRPFFFAVTGGQGQLFFAGAVNQP